MKNHLLKIAFVGAVAFSSQIYAFGNFNDSPMNFNNSPMNFDNSPMNFKNSPMNFNNSRMNPNSSNRIYDQNGNDIGYGVQKSNGGMNFFSNDGRRRGYKPGY